MPQTTQRTARCRVVIAARGISVPYWLSRSGSGWLWIKSRNVRYHVVEDTSGRFVCTCKGYLFAGHCKHSDFVKHMFSGQHLLDEACRAIEQLLSLSQRQKANEDNLSEANQALRQKVEDLERQLEEQVKQLAIFTPAPKPRSRSKKAKQS